MIWITPGTSSLSEYAVPWNQIFFEDVPDGEPLNRFIATAGTPTFADQHRPRQKEHVRRFHFEFSEDWPVNGPRRLYIPSGGTNMNVFLNGVSIGASTPNNFFAPGYGRSWQVKDISRAHLLPGENRLTIEINRDDARSGLSDIFIGPALEITRVADHQRRWMRILPAIVFWVGAAVIIMSLLGMVYGTRMRAYLVKGCIGCLVVVLGAASYIPASESVRTLDTTLRLFLPFVLLLSILLLQLYDEKDWDNRPMIKVAFYGFALIGPLLALLQMILPVSMRAPNLSASLALLSPLPLLIYGGGQNIWQDLLAHRNRIEALTEKVSEQAEELDEQSQLIAREMRNRAVLEERQRFTRDIHDGIGGQLLSLLLRVRTGGLKMDEIATEIQAGLDDLRLVVDSMDHTGESLVSALMTFRARAENQLAAAGMKLVWEQSEQIYKEFPDPRGTLHLYRFMQEAIANVIKHSKADTVHVRIFQTSAGKPLIVSLADDGIGLPQDVDQKPGKGLGNLRARAQKLGGSLRFEPLLKDEGLQITLEIPAEDVTAQIA